MVKYCIESCFLEMATYWSNQLSILFPKKKTPQFMFSYTEKTGRRTGLFQLFGM